MKFAIPLMLLVVITASHASEAKPPIAMGDYDAEMRLPDGHVDNATLLQRLQEMHANTYYYLIWHAATDWEDLQAFLPLAERAGIQVWAYLCPHSESGGLYPYSEPFRTDYVRWAQEIGKLSLAHANLVGYVIDDFYANYNPAVLSAQYIRAMVAAGKAVNPRLKFYPLMYYGEIDGRFTDALTGDIDGVVAAYPAGRRDMLRAVQVLNDAVTTSGSCEVAYPSGHKSGAGDFASLSQIATVTNADAARVSFHYEDDFDGPTQGYHIMQLRVDGEVVWSEDVAGHDAKTVAVSLPRAIAAKPSVKLTLGVFDQQGVSQFGVRVTFSRLRVTGLRLRNSDLGDVRDWHVECRGAFRAECRPGRTARHAFHIPLVVMPAGDRREYSGRYPDEPNTANIAARTREALELARAGRIEGVVMYCLDKSPGNEDLAAVGQLYAEFGEK